jgi:hypothetical protein
MSMSQLPPTPAEPPVDSLGGMTVGLEALYPPPEGEPGQSTLATRRSFASGWEQR